MAAFDGIWDGVWNGAWFGSEATRAVGGGGKKKKLRETWADLNDLWDARQKWSVKAAQWLKQETKAEKPAEAPTSPVTAEVSPPDLSSLDGLLVMLKRFEADASEIHEALEAGQRNAIALAAVEAEARIRRLMREEEEAVAMLMLMAA